MQLIDALFDLCKATPHPIITIDGPAGAGKTTLAEHVSAAMSLKYKCTTLHMDDLYNGWETPFDHHLTDALIGACRAHQKSQKISLSIYNWGTGKYGAVQEVPPCQLLILEGVASSQLVIREFVTASIWIDIDPAVGVERVLLRDGDAISHQMNSWLNKQAQHFLDNDSQNASDFVLTN
jgi:uridine kinase